MLLGIISILVFLTPAPYLLIPFIIHVIKNWDKLLHGNIDEIE